MSDDMPKHLCSLELTKTVLILHFIRITTACVSTSGSRMHGHCIGGMMCVSDTMSTQTLSS